MFYFAKFLDPAAERDQRDAIRPCDKRSVSPNRHLVRFERQRPHTTRARLGRQSLLNEPLDDQLQIRAVPLSRRRIPGIGGQHRIAAGGEQQRGIRAEQAGEVIDVRYGSNKSRIGANVGDFLNRPLPPRRMNIMHARTLRGDRLNREQAPAASTDSRKARTPTAPTIAVYAAGMPVTSTSMPYVPRILAA